MTEKSNRWDIPKQEFLVENGQIGDCWACCIAAVLGVPRKTVPHFLQDDPSGQRMDQDTQRWLNDRGLVLIHVDGADLEYPRWAGESVPMLPVIAAGPTSRSKRMGQHHAVVMIGRELVYDPHPSGDGLTWITDRYLIVRPGIDEVKA